MSKAQVKDVLKVALIALGAYAATMYVQQRVTTIPVVGRYLPR